MWFKHRAWRPVAWFLCVANLFFVWAAAGPGESLHATTHGLLAVLFGLGAQRLALRRAPGTDAAEVGSLRDLEARIADLDRLQGVEGRLPELEERLDFIERALVDVRNRSQRLPNQ